MKQLMTIQILAGMSLIGGFLLSGCSTPLETATESGGKVVEVDKIEQIGDRGVTHTDSEGAWIAYYGPDGRKVVFVKSRDETAELKWRQNENGEFCEENYSDGGKETCGNPKGIVYVQHEDGSYSSFDANGMKRYTWTVESGNPNNL